MTNPTNTGYLVHSDEWTTEAIWRGDPDAPDCQPIVSRYDTDPEVYRLLVNVLTEPDEAVEAIAKAVHNAWPDADVVPWSDLSEGDRESGRHYARAALAALRSLGGA